MDGGVAAVEGAERNGSWGTTGVDESRREEIDVFLSKRFKTPRDKGVKARNVISVLRANDPCFFLSERFLIVQLGTRVLKVSTERRKTS